MDYGYLKSRRHYMTVSIKNIIQKIVIIKKKVDREKRYKIKTKLLLQVINKDIFYNEWTIKDIIICTM